jgi:hypothetical protein
MLNTFTVPYSPSNTVLRKASGFWLCAYTATAIFGGVIVWSFGHRGIALFDQSAVFDGAWRIVQGQVIYRDFFFPMGRSPTLIQSLFFRIRAGVDISSLVLARHSQHCGNRIRDVARASIIRRPYTSFDSDCRGLVTAVMVSGANGLSLVRPNRVLFQSNGISPHCRGGFPLERTGVVSARGRRLPARHFRPLQTEYWCAFAVPLGAVFLTALPIGRKTFDALFQVVAGVVIAVGIFVVWLWSFFL